MTRTHTIREQPPLLVHFLIPLYILLRVGIANRLPLTDCDEVYQYWEPLFHSTHNNTGGFQTWEYAHEIALRTYAYILPYQLLLKMIQRLPANAWLPFTTLLVDFVPSHTNLAIFVLLRSIQAALTATAELYFLLTIRNATSTHVWYSLVVLLALGSSGIHHASGALLPTTTWMQVYWIAAALIWQRRYHAFGTLAVTATLVTGWPFGAVLLLPMGIYVLAKQPWKRLIPRITLTTILVQAIVTCIDYVYYGKWTCTSCNIFRYNASQQQDSLYGVEPLSFYGKNIALNLNVLGLLGLGGLVVVLGSQHRTGLWIAILAPLYTWLLITLPRPHKEERFLVPAYPVWILSAVLLVDRVANWCGRMRAAVSRHKDLTTWQRTTVYAIVGGMAVLVTTARTFALHKYYMAPIYVYAYAAQHVPSNETICTGNDWYRFPSSFFLTNLRFGPSSGVREQLPQPFSLYGSQPESLKVQGPFNTVNAFEASRITPIEECDWWIGTDVPLSVFTTRVYGHALIDVDRSRLPGRAIVLPFGITESQVQYNDFALYRR